MRFVFLLGLVIALLPACAGLDSFAESRAPFDLGPLPVGQRTASDVPTVLGNAFIEKGGTATVSGTALVIDATGSDHFSYGLYGYNLPAGYRLGSASFEVQDVTAATNGGYYIGYADYGGAGLWEWHGPYLDNASPAFSGPAANYLSPDRSFYFAVVAPHGVKVQFNQCLVQIDLVPVEVPPIGQQAVDQQAMTPSLAVLPATAPNISADAPVVAYLKLEGTDTKLYLAYYSQDQWVKLPILPSHNFAGPMLRWLGGGESVLVAYDSTSNELVDIRLRQDFSIASTTAIMSNPGTAFFGASLDVDPISGALGVAHIYSTEESGALYFSESDGSGWQNGPSVYAGDSVGGASFRYDPAGGDPWLLYTHGTIDRTDMILIDFMLESGRLSGGSWQFTPVEFPDSPLAVRLNFAADNTPEATFLSAREFVNTFPPIVASLLYDVYAGSYGTSWSFDEIFHGSLTPHLEIPNILMDIDDATGTDWAASDALIYSQATGTITISLSTLQPTGGTLAPDVHYMVNSGGWSENTSYFTGDEGRNFSWGATAAGPSTAYILSQPLDAVAIFSGQLNQASDLLYWSK